MKDPPARELAGKASTVRGASGPPPDRTHIFDAYYKKTIEVRWHRRRCVFALPTTGFSSFGIDLGTSRLLRGIDLAKPRWKRALDLGCGYGPIGSHLLVTGMADQVVGIDRDLLALEYCKMNARANGLAEMECVGGLAYEDVPAGKYSAIVSNLPAKAGDTVHRMVLLGASGLLEPGGEVWIVAVSPLEARIDGMLAIEQVMLLAKRSYNGHVVYRYAFRSPVEGPDDPYLRGRSTFAWRGFTYDIDAFAGLAEFDTLSYETDLVLSAAHRLFKGRTLKKIVVCTPGQGHLAAILPGILGGVGALVFVSRDALALKAASLNARRVMAGVGIQAIHSIAYWEDKMGTDADLFVAALDKKEGIPVSALKIAQASFMCPNSVFLVACSISLRFRLIAQLRSLGVSAETTIEDKGGCVLACVRA